MNCYVDVKAAHLLSSHVIHTEQGVKMEEVEKGLDGTAETLLAFFRQAELQQQKCFICKEVNYRSTKVKIIPSVTFLHYETESQK